MVHGQHLGRGVICGALTNSCYAKTVPLFEIIVTLELVATLDLLHLAQPAQLPIQVHFFLHGTLLAAHHFSHVFSTVVIVTVGLALLKTVRAVVILMLTVEGVMPVAEEVLEMVLVIVAVLVMVVALDLPHSAQPAHFPTQVHFFDHG